MHTPWHNKTGIPKAIAIVATIGIIAFGLCTANLFVPPLNSERWERVQSYVAGAYSVTVILSVVVLIVLLVLKAWRSLGSKDD